jgi:hypothetical protein
MLEEIVEASAVEEEEVSPAKYLSTILELFTSSKPGIMTIYNDCYHFFKSLGQAVIAEEATAEEDADVDVERRTTRTSGSLSPSLVAS